MALTIVADKNHAQLLTSNYIGFELLEPSKSDEGVPGLHMLRYNSNTRNSREIQTLPVWYLNETPSIRICTRNERTRLTMGWFDFLLKFYNHGYINDITIDRKEEFNELRLCDKSRKKFIKLTGQYLEHYFVLTNNGDIILPLKHSPPCFSTTPLTQVNSFTEVIDRSVLANSSAILLQGCHQPDNINFLQKNMNLTCYRATSGINIVPNPKNFDQMQICSEFLCNYAWQMVLSLGYQIQDRLDSGTMRRVQSLAANNHGSDLTNSFFYRMMLAVYNHAKSNRFFDISKEFQKVEPVWLPPIRPNYVYIPRLILTPYGLYPRPIKPSNSNRVMREMRFGEPTLSYCRVLLKDCSFDQMQSNAVKSFRVDLKDILLRTGLIIGGEKFHFLLFSNSQLRDRSFYFYRQQACQVEDIYRWLGDFEHEKCIGTRLARMAQCFTSTQKGIKLKINQLVAIPDKFDCQSRCFTDGCGQISTDLLKKLWAKVKGNVETDQLPSAIQIRLGGIKGVLVHEPKIHGELVYFTASQRKFKSSHLELEFIKSSQMSLPSFNQQLITLLEYAGATKLYFKRLQNKYRMKLSMALVDHRQAIKLLKTNIHQYRWASMLECGVDVTEEPFFRSLLMTIVRDRLGNLRRKTHIPVKREYGASLLGVADFNEVLKEGEIFIQIPDENSSDGSKYRIITEHRVIVTRMPCHHPGDIRILQAVNHPALHHLKNCVVFPVVGSRPHPTEMSGGDLDGDEYWTCWDPTLLEQINKISSPGDYTAPKKPIQTSAITSEMLIDNILEIVERGNQVGMLSRRHLAICDAKSPNDQKALEVAEYISDALDFPKTGVQKMTTQDLKNTMVKKYPNFMMNSHKESYPSEKVLGHLFREIDQTAQQHETAEQKPVLTEIDPNYLIAGCEVFLHVAYAHYIEYHTKIQSILNLYELKSETELITGCHFTQPDELKNNDDIETATAEYRTVRIITRKTFDETAESLWEKVDKHTTENINEIKKKLASAYYCVAYYSKIIFNNVDNQTQNIKTKYLSFAWVVDDLLIQIKQQSKYLIKPCGEKIGKIWAQRFPNTHYDAIGLFVAGLKHEMITNVSILPIDIRCIKLFATKNDDTAYSFWQNSSVSHNEKIGEQIITLIKHFNDSNDEVLQQCAGLALNIFHRIATTESAF